MTRTLITCSPYFTDLALNEVRRYHVQCSVIEQLAPGYMLLQAPCSFDKLTSPWRNRSPIYLHHAFPVHHILPLDANTDDLLQLKQYIQQITTQDATVQVRSLNDGELPYSALEVERFLNPKGNSTDQAATPQGRILSIVLAYSEQGLRAYLGISWATQNLSPWTGGQLPVQHVVANRAGLKLLEALQTFGIRLRRGNTALDLGASPGAWTTILRQFGLVVTSIAPTPLYPWLMLDPQVTYHPTRAEDYLNHCATTFDLIVNDMKLDARDSARLMVDYAIHLRHEGIVIMTLKLWEQNKQRTMDHAFRLLRKRYKIIQIRQLVSNRKEITLFLRRKD